MPKFSVPAGCRDAMTALHNAHTERYGRIKNRLQQMHVAQKEDHRIIGAFMDTHNVLHGAVQKALKTCDASSAQKRVFPLERVLTAFFSAFFFSRVVINNLRTENKID